MMTFPWKKLESQTELAACLSIERIASSVVLAPIVLLLHHLSCLHRLTMAFPMSALVLGALWWAFRC